MVVKCTPLVVPLFSIAGCKDEVAGGAIFARRKNPPCKSLPLRGGESDRSRERERERWIKGVGVGMKEDGDEETEDGERVHERKSETRRADKQA